MRGVAFLNNEEEIEMKLFTTLLGALAAGITFADTQVVDGITWHYQLDWTGKEATLGVGQWYSDDDSSWFVLQETAVSKSLSGSIRIPETLGGCPVKTIGYEAFCECTKISEVVIPPSVSLIEDRAFASCSGLKFEASCISVGA